MRERILFQKPYESPFGRNINVPRGTSWETADGVKVAFRFSSYQVGQTKIGGGDLCLYGTLTWKPKAVDALVERLRGSPYTIERKIRKLLKEEQLYRQRKTWDQALLDECKDKRIVKWANERLSELATSTRDGCIDNYRVAAVKNSSQVRRYQKQKERGCCGYVDTKETCPIDGRTYLLGFNYGH